MKSAPVDPEVLRRSEVFRALEEVDRRTLALCLQGRTYRSGEIVFREGDPGATLLIIAEGTFVATTRRADGVEQPLHEMGPAELAGEMSFLDPGPRSATVKAFTDGVAYELSHDAMDVLRRQAPLAAAALVTAAIHDVTRRLRSLDESIARALERLGAPDGRSTT
jgi:CRP-like cAMP-binding protein